MSTKKASDRKRLPQEAALKGDLWDSIARSEAAGASSQRAITASAIEDTSALATRLALQE
jgi:hypothetical protein